MTRILDQNIGQLLADHPYFHDFLNALAIGIPDADITLNELIRSQPESHLAGFSLTHTALAEQAAAFIKRMSEFQGQAAQLVTRVTIKAGTDKSGQPEPMDVTLKTGEMVSIVGPTGSGKSMLLADIECLAQGDTPSGRQILLDDRVPDDSLRFSGDLRMVAQLSQNMNFVMDLSVEEFLTMHAESRLVDHIDDRVSCIFEAAVGLAGEPFSMKSPVTALSGGQSRALMIADTAFLSASPIVLIDEVENAGVDRQRALDLLVKKEKIVLMATHDPLLALSGHRRIVIENGGIARIITTSDQERCALDHLKVIDGKLARLRERLRHGEHIAFNTKWMG